MRQAAGNQFHWAGLVEPAERAFEARTHTVPGRKDPSGQSSRGSSTDAVAVGAVAAAGLAVTAPVQVAEVNAYRMAQ